MNKFLRIIGIAAGTMFGTSLYAQVCNPAGNIVVFSNYDGGTLNINVDVNIPNLKIGIVSYETVQVNLSGPFVGNITGVEYAGYNTPSTYCSPGIATTVFSGVPVTVTPMIRFLPAATISDPDGWSSIVCAYSCGSGSMGGCNTPEQVYDYFQNRFSGIIYSHTTQYGCWSGSWNVSSGGNCCAAPAAAPLANFSMSNDTICVGECINFTDMSSNVPTSWAWSFVGASTSSSSLQNPSSICYAAPGVYTATLVATNSIGDDTITKTIVVNSVDAGTTTTGLTISANETGATYQWLSSTDNCSTYTVLGTTSSSLTVSSNGYYAVVVTKNGCTDTSACVQISTVGMMEETTPDQFMIAPNPTNGLVVVQDLVTGNEIKKISVATVLGKTIYTSSFNQRMDLDLSGQPTGLYFVTIESKNAKTVSRIIKK